MVRAFEQAGNTKAVRKEVILDKETRSPRGVGDNSILPPGYGQRAGMIIFSACALSILFLLRS